MHREQDAKIIEQVSLCVSVMCTHASARLLCADAMSRAPGLCAGLKMLTRELLQPQAHKRAPYRHKILGSGFSSLLRSARSRASVLALSRTSGFMYSCCACAAAAVFDALVVNLILQACLGFLQVKRDGVDSVLT